MYNIRKSTYEDIVSYIKETVVSENKPQFASDILDRYYYNQFLIKKC